MLNDRRRLVLCLLLAADGPRSAAELGRLLGLPARAVRYDLAEVEAWVNRYGAVLTGHAGLGYRLEGDLDRVRAELDSLAQSTTPKYEYVLSPRERVRRMLLHLVGKDGPTPLGTLAGLLGAGKSTVHADTAAVEAWLTARGLQLERSHLGLCVEAAEVFRRQAMAELVEELADEGQLAMLLEGNPDAISLQRLLEPMLPLVDWPAIGAAVRQAGCPEAGVYLAVAVSRLSSGYTLPFNPDQIDRVTGTPSWRRAQAVAGALEQAAGIRLPSTELASLALFLESAKPAAGDSGQDAPTEADLDMARALANLVQTRLGIPLTQDHEFVAGLALHLRPIQHRLLRGLLVQNPLLDEVRTKYRVAYRAAEEVAHVLEAAWQAAVPEAEVGFLAIHIAAAIERARPLRRTTYKALLVCGAGVGTAQLLASRLKGTAPEIEVGRTTSAFRVREALAAEPFDLVIATCQVPPCEIPVVRVSPLLSDGDLAALRRTLHRLSDDSGRGRVPMLKDVLTKSTIALDVDAMDWEGAVRAAGALLVSAGAAEERYVDAMIRTARELGPYIVLGPGFALPHARPEDGARQIGIAMARLRQPVAFGHPENDPVDLVFALCAIDHETHLTALMQLSDLLGDEDALHTLRTAADPDAILVRIAAVSGAADLQPSQGEARP